MHEHRFTLGSLMRAPGFAPRVQPRLNAIVLVLFAAAVASFIPARSSMRIDPVIALRSEA